MSYKERAVFQCFPNINRSYFVMISIVSTEQIIE